MDLLSENQAYLVLIIFIITAIIIFVSMLMLLKIQKQKNAAVMETVRNLEELNGKLRSQRHDYINQLQVIYGLLELSEYDEARKYLKPIFKDMMKVGKALKTRIPAVNALLMAKMQTAEGLNVDMYVEVKSDLAQIGIEGWELCKVLSNIIDNAIRAVESNDGIRKVIVDINENSDEYIINISNNGPEISDEEKKKIFKAGYSTKSEQEHGLGLSIVSEIMRANNAQVNVASSEEETVFELKFVKGGN